MPFEDIACEAASLTIEDRLKAALQRKITPAFVGAATIEDRLKAVLQRKITPAFVGAASLTIEDRLKAGL